MNLTEIETEYVEHEYINRGRALLDEFFKKANSISTVKAKEFGTSKTQIYAEQVRRCAKDTIETMVSSYIESCRKIKKFPDDSDLQRFISTSKPWVTNKLKLFTNHVNNPFGESVPKAITDALEHSLTFELNSIFAAGLKPLLSFQLEGAIEAERRKKNAQSSPGHIANAKGPWSRDQRIAIVACVISVILGILSIIATILYPELRSWFRLFN